METDRIGISVLVNEENFVNGYHRQILKAFKNIQALFKFSINYLIDFTKIRNVSIKKIKKN